MFQYALMLALIMLAELTGGILALVYRTKVRQAQFHRNGTIAVRNSPTLHTFIHYILYLRVMSFCVKITSKILYTVKLVHKHHPRDQQSVVLIHRWSLYAISKTWKINSWGPVKCGLYKKVVCIYRWSLE